MRQLSNEEMKDVSGALCSSLTLSFSVTGPTISGRLGDWMDCYNRLSDRVYAEYAHYSTGIRYGEAHVG
ncbi:MAG TPA: hypothetical protein VFX81_01120 [Burkholderiaceae bacterium]|jgi:hypothetical protein|nr:hypothetical protein [Burkholderiaceae bacterium]